MSVLFDARMRVQCGEKTCAREPGKFCQFLYAKKNGGPLCGLFNQNLLEIQKGDKTGWTRRCDPCYNAEYANKTVM